jgi:hypothetical protein
MSVDASARKKPPATPATPAPEVAGLPVRVRIWADREVSIANHKNTLARVPGVTAVAVDEAAKVATLTYTGDWKGLGEIGAALNSQGTVIDPALFAAHVTAHAPSASLQRLPDLLGQVRGVRRMLAAGSAVEFWASIPDLDLDGLLGLGYRFSFITCEVLEFSLAARGGGEPIDEFKRVLMDTRGVLRADVAGSTVRVLALKGKVTTDTLKKLAGRFEMDVAPIKR